MKVEIDGVCYIPVDQSSDDKAMRILEDVYGELFVEACYDPTNDSVKVFASRLYEKMRAANAILKFKK